MISYPKNWKKIGQSITHIEIENTIMQVLRKLNCNSLSFSGGLDSSLMLYYMLKIYPRVHAFTMGVSELHPDIRYSKLVISHFNNVIHKIYIPSSEEIENVERYSGDFAGDGAVRLFYKYVNKYTDKIIACDGVDEFMCGYYAHQKSPCENTYYTYLRELSSDHLVPLHKHSGNVKVFLPYLDDELLLLFSQIPLNEKVDETHRKKLLVNISKGKVSDEVINRRKYGFCDVLEIK